MNVATGIKIYGEGKSFYKERGGAGDEGEERGMKLPFKKIAKRLTGISTPLFGVSWRPSKSERDLVRKLLAYMEDRRALYNPYDVEMPEYVDRSILEIRQRLTSDIESLEENSDVAGHLRALRAASRKFLDQVQGAPNRHLLHYWRNNVEFFSALGELRAIFGIHIAQLAVKYGINLEEGLASILSIADD